MSRASFACLATIVLLTGFVRPAQAEVFLEITEIWPGNVNGDDLTEDWIGISDQGSTRWNPAIHGDLYLKIESPEPGGSESVHKLTGLDSIGREAIFVNGSDMADDANTRQWKEVWSGPLADARRPVPQVGSYNGPDFQIDDCSFISLLLDSNFNGPQDDDLLAPPNRIADPVCAAGSSERPGVSINLPARLSVNWSDAPFSFRLPVITAPNNAGESAVATPGYIPEPGSAALAGLAASLWGWRRRPR